MAKRGYAAGDPTTRFWAKVSKHEGPDACWEWSAGRQPNGYGRFRVDAARMEWAHRYAYELQHGPLGPGECALHTCDNRLCMRGTHLFKGTRTDNAADRDAKDRTSRGAPHSAAVRAAWARRKGVHYESAPEEGERRYAHAHPRMAVGESLLRTRVVDIGRDAGSER